MREGLRETRKNQDKHGKDWILSMVLMPNHQKNIKMHEIGTLKR
jgi:hypothetical protein